MAKSAALDTQTLAAAFRGSRWRFRTAAGIADDLGVTPDEVTRALARHPDIARRSPMTDQMGRDLFAAADYPLTLRERLEQVRWILAH